MPQPRDMTNGEFRIFRDHFCKSRHEWVIEEDICRDTLWELDRKLDCSEETRKKMLDDLAANIVDFIEKRMRHLMREEFETIRALDHTPRQKVEAYRRHIEFYEKCYKQTMGEIDRFDEEHPLHPIGSATKDHARKGYAHFETLANTYIEMLALELTQK